jgi:hypothetical protein
MQDSGSYCDALVCKVGGKCLSQLIAVAGCAVVAIPEKPNHLKAKSRPSENELRAAKALLADMSVLKHEDSMPEQLFVLPITTNQNYGFFHSASPLTEHHKLWHHPKLGCDVTQYADAYCTMTGLSPYSSKQAA